MILPISDFSNMSANAAMTFPPSHWNQVLKLLGLIIVADKKTLPVEVDTFLDAVEELRELIDPTVSLTRHMARDWFVRNREGLEEIIDSLAYDTAICDILAPIKLISHKMDVINHMLKIAISDDEYANVEKGLIKKTILYWNIQVQN